MQTSLFAMNVDINSILHYFFLVFIVQYGTPDSEVKKTKETKINPLT